MDTDGESLGSSFIPQIGHMLGSALLTSGCMGQAYAVTANAACTGSSLMPHRGHDPGSAAVTSGCIGHAYEVAARSWSPDSRGISATKASTLSAGLARSCASD